MVWFQNDLLLDNLYLATAKDVNNDGFTEVFWETVDGTAFLRSIHHLDGNIKYANYMDASQMNSYLLSYSETNIINILNIMN